MMGDYKSKRIERMRKIGKRIKKTAKRGYRKVKRKLRRR